MEIDATLKFGASPTTVGLQIVLQLTRMQKCYLD